MIEKCLSLFITLLKINQMTNFPANFFFIFFTQLFPLLSFFKPSNAIQKIYTKRGSFYNLNGKGKRLAPSFLPSSSICRATPETLGA